MADPLNGKPPTQLQRELSVILAPRHGLLACAAISAALLTGAFLFEYVGGMAPCKLCIWQLQENGRGFPPNYLHESWRDYLYWDTELQQT